MTDTIAFVEKQTLISRLLAFLEVKSLGKLLIHRLVQYRLSVDYVAKVSSNLAPPFLAL